MYISCVIASLSVIPARVLASAKFSTAVRKGSERAKAGDDAAPGAAGRDTMAGPGDDEDKEEGSRGQDGVSSSSPSEDVGRRGVGGIGGYTSVRIWLAVGVGRAAMGWDRDCGRVSMSYHGGVVRAGHTSSSSLFVST